MYPGKAVFQHMARNCFSFHRNLKLYKKNSNTGQFFACKPSNLLKWGQVHQQRGGVRPVLLSISNNSVPLLCTPSLHTPWLPLAAGRKSHRGWAPWLICICPESPFIHPYWKKEAHRLCTPECCQGVRCSLADTWGWSHSHFQAGAGSQAISPSDAQSCGPTHSWMAGDAGKRVLCMPVCVPDPAKHDINAGCWYGCLLFALQKIPPPWWDRRTA